MRLSRLLFIVTLGIACVVFTVSAQNQEQKQTTPPPVSADDFQKAHQTVFGSETDKAAEASRLTSSFAAAGSGTVENVARKNFVDEVIFGRMERDKVPHAPLASDEEFLRRAYLDATGLLPTPAKVREFVENKDANKRDKLIDSLIGSDDFADQWGPAVQRDLRRPGGIPGHQKRQHDPDLGDLWAVVV